MDKHILFKVALGRMLCAVARRLATHLLSRTRLPLNQRIREHYSAHIFEAYVRLDLPTFEDPLVRQQLEAAWGRGRPWLGMLSNSFQKFFATTVSLVSQLSVLRSVLRGQRDGLLIACLSFCTPLLNWMRLQRFSMRGGTSTSAVYVSISGLTDILNTQFGLRRAGTKDT